MYLKFFLILNFQKQYLRLYLILLIRFQFWTKL